MVSEAIRQPLQCGKSWTLHVEEGHQLPRGPSTQRGSYAPDNGHERRRSARREAGLKGLGRRRRWCAICVGVIPKALASAFSAPTVVRATARRPRRCDRCRCRPERACRPVLPSCCALRLRRKGSPRSRTFPFAGRNTRAYSGHAGFAVPNDVTECSDPIRTGIRAAW